MTERTLLKMLRAMSEPIYETNVELSLMRVHDGDSLIAQIKGYPKIIGSGIIIRTYGKDAPELKDKRPDIREIALKAKARLEELASVGLLVAKTMRRDKFFRIDCDLTNGVVLDLGEKMQGEGLLRPYFGQGPRPW